jgi:hypothetical protein
MVISTRTTSPPMVNPTTSYSTVKTRFSDNFWGEKNNGECFHFCYLLKDHFKIK